MSMEYAIMILAFLSIIVVCCAVNIYRKKRDVLAHTRDYRFPSDRPHRVRLGTLAGVHGGGYLLMLVVPVFLAMLYGLIWFVWAFVSTFIEMGGLIGWT
jgi:hypothetical protein